jgi:hypothetical protein
MLDLLARANALGIAVDVLLDPLEIAGRGLEVFFYVR